MGNNQKVQATRFILELKFYAKDTNLSKVIL